MNKKVSYLLVVLIVFALNSGIYGQSNRIELVDYSEQADFAISRLNKVLEEKSLSYHVTLKVNPDLADQAFSLRTKGSEITIEGGDALGLMYGGLELAERIELDYDISNLNISKVPFQKNRGLKFNIPLDARCPSYDDTGDAAQKNIENMWDFDFWKEYFDRMALHRYNVLSLWTPNPFQVMVKLPDFPEVALNDVCVTTTIPNGEVGEWADAGGVNDTVLNNLVVVKELNIDEKIAFWQKVFTYAQSRGVDIYLYTWNIYTNGTYGKYGLTDDINNPNTKAYYRQAINVFLQTYPQVKGVGVTAGERMHVGKGKDVADERERWLWEAYGLGILDYKKINPEREISFIHRVWYSKFDQIMKYWAAYPDPFEVGFKYVKARIYSSPNESPFIGAMKKSLEENKMKCWWNLRNDDIYVYRWGDPDYVRGFIGNLPAGITAGYHMGPDGYVFAKVFSDKAETINGTMEFEKHWYKFMLWGRLGYDNELSNEHFKRMLAKRYEVKEYDQLFRTWQAASKIIPQVNRFIFHTGDRHWSPEMCSSRESFKYTACFRLTNPMPGTGTLMPKRYWELKQTNKLNDEWQTPIQTADSLNKWSNYVLATIDKVEGEGVELNAVKSDLQAFAWLGRYYASKISAADLMEEIAWQGPTKERSKQLINYMDSSVVFWGEYASESDKNYYTQMYSRVNIMDWKAIQKEVDYDREIVLKMYTEKSFEQQLILINEELSIDYPYKGISKRVGVNTPKRGMAELILYDERGEMINYYRHKCKEGFTNLMWEDLAWMPKGNYTLVLNFEGKTAIKEFEK